MGEVQDAKRQLLPPGETHIAFEPFLEWWEFVRNQRKSSLLSMDDRMLQKRRKCIELFKTFDTDFSGFIEKDEFPELHACVIQRGWSNLSLQKNFAMMDV